MRSAGAWRLQVELVEDVAGVELAAAVPLVSLPRLEHEVLVELELLVEDLADVELAIARAVAELELLVEDVAGVELGGASWCILVHLGAEQCTTSPTRTPQRAARAQGPR